MIHMQLFRKGLQVAFFGLLALSACAGDTTKVQQRLPLNADADNAGLKLPSGFTASLVSGNSGRTRHLTVNTNGDVYVKLEKLRDGKGILRLRDRNKDGKMDDSLLFGNFVGTGIKIKNGYLYASSNEDVYRFKLNAQNDIENPDKPEKIIANLWNKRQHEAKAFTLDNAGNIYVNIGAPSNDCQVQDRTQGSPGQKPCPILDSAGGIWQFKADKLNQGYADGVRYATGLRNVVGLDWNDVSNDLYVTQHGRDMLYQFYPQMFSQKDGAESPAEEMFRVKKGADCGWPYCYFDNAKKKKLLNPEYGGDREKVGECADKTQSIVQFPGHLAPNDLLFYTGSQFPEKYKNGAFIAFHGSWNRSPEPQAGYFVVFVPFKDGMPNGQWEVFADGFAGNIDLAKDRAESRPCGLAQAPDGSLYVCDDSKGKIWKIGYASK
jgi:glucose/arabinose dehydrogenase